MTKKALAIDRVVLSMAVASVSARAQASSAGGDILRLCGRKQTLPAGEYRIEQPSSKAYC